MFAGYHKTTPNQLKFDPISSEHLSKSVLGALWVANRSAPGCLPDDGGETNNIVFSQKDGPKDRVSNICKSKITQQSTCRVSVGTIK